MSIFYQDILKLYSECRDFVEYISYKFKINHNLSREIKKKNVILLENVQLLFMQIKRNIGLFIDPCTFVVMSWYLVRERKYCFTTAVYTRCIISLCFVPCKY